MKKKTLSVILALCLLIPAFQALSTPAVYADPSGVETPEVPEGSPWYFDPINYGQPSDTVTATAKAPRSFSDVPADAYFARPVAWAVSCGITAGTGADTFSPDDECTRAQAVTFLWRAAGSPEPTPKSNPFGDVAESDYFFKAVLWAVGEEITKGTSNTAFSPDDVCTRAQIVTFLYRANVK